MTEPLETQVIGLLAEVFGLPAAEIPADLALGRIPQWDSMGHMNLLLRLEERHGVPINEQTIGALTSLPAILAYLTERSSD